MKTTILLILVLLFSGVIQAQKSKFISNLSPGSLITQMTSEELSTVTILTISGTMDARDFKTMRDKMPKLTVIDLTYIKIAAYVGTNGTSLFIGEPVQDITYPENTIPDGAFYEGFYFNENKNLTTVLLPDSVTAIGDDAFLECDYLKGIYMPSKVTSIGRQAFKNCSSLTFLTIPASVTSIGYSAFAQCKALKSIVAYPVLPVALPSPDVFEGVDKNTCTLHIPIKSLSLYQSANVWRDFLNFIAIPLPTRKTINNLTPGNLVKLMTREELTTLKSLELKGTMDARDFKILRDSMPNLKDVGLRNINIAAYTGEEGTDQRDENNKIVSYPANTIPTCAFEKCDSLVSVSLPYSTTAIGLAAFEACYQLMYVDIPRSVTSIGNAAFRYCTALNEISFPSTLTTIGAYAFMYCNQLTDITLPNTVTSMGMGVFQNCSQMPSIILPPITAIPDYAFSGCSALKSVYIPKTVQTIGEYAFSNCDSLQSIIIPNSVSTINSGAFYNCHELTSVTLPSSLTSIGERVFGHCTKLISITTYAATPVALPSANVFDGVVNNTCTLNVPEGSMNLYKSANVWKDFINVKAIQSSTSKTLSVYSPGSLITLLTSEELSTTTNLTLTGTIDASDFTIMRDSMPNLAVVDLSGVTIAKYSGWAGPRGQWERDYPANMTPHWAFQEKRSLTAVTLPASIHTIDHASFEGCSNLSSVNIPPSVTFIGNGAFGGCKSLTSVTIPESVITIGADAYRSCSGLKVVTIPSSVKTIDGGAFSSCTSLTSISIPSSVTTIGSNAFWGCDKISAFKIPASVTSIGNGAFSQCNAPITVEAENSHYSSLDGVLFNKAQTVLIHCPISKSGSYTIPLTVKKIEEYAFSSCKELIVAKLPAALDTIGIRAFFDCGRIENINLPSTLKFLGGGAFDGCMALYFPTIPPTISSIEGSTFSRCYSLGSIKIPSSIKSIGSSAFYNSIGLKAVSFPNSLDTIIGQYAFAYCTSLQSIQIPDSVIIIEESAFTGCCSLTSVTLPAKVSIIGDRAFGQCKRLMSIKAYPKMPVELPSPDVFYNVDKTACTLYVLAESLDLYKAAPVWRDFLKIEAIMTSIEKEINPTVSIFPNPAKDVITINADKGIVSIYNSQGTLEITQSLQKDKKVNISSLATGIYVVVVNGESFKVVKE